MSSTKRTIAPYILVNNQPITTNFTSNPFSIQLYDRSTLSMEFTGTLAGSITLQVSNDYVPPTQSQIGVVNPPNWIDSNLSFNALAGAPNRYFVDFPETGVPWFRISVVYVSGSGNLTAVVTAKES